MNNSPDLRPLVCIISSRLGCLSEGGEWNLIHNRDKGLVEDSGMAVGLFQIAKEEHRDAPLAHLKNSGYLHAIFHYRLAVLGRLRAVRAAVRAAAGSGAQAVILTGDYAGLWTAFFRRRGIYTIYDLHGAVFDEIDEFKAGSWLSRLYTRVSWWASLRWARQADAVFCVTPELAKWARPYFPNSRMLIVPCATRASVGDWNEHERLRMIWRERFGIPGEALVMVHSGGLGGWQGTDEYSRELPRLMQRERSLWFLCLTGNTRAISEKIAEFPAEIAARCKVGSVPSTDVISALCAADLGLLLRAECVTNRVAFPNKLDEYLAAGLYVVTSKGLPAAANICRQDPCVGTLVDYPKLNIEEACFATQFGEPLRVHRWKRAQEVRQSFAYGTTLAPLRGLFGAREDKQSRRNGD